MYGLHFGHIMNLLDRLLLAPLLAFLGIVLGGLGYFERDKKRVPALIGMILNAALLGIWVYFLLNP